VSFGPARTPSVNGDRDDGKCAARRFSQDLARSDGAQTHSSVADGAEQD